MPKVAISISFEIELSPEQILQESRWMERLKRASSYIEKKLDPQKTNETDHRDLPTFVGVVEHLATVFIGAEEREKYPEAWNHPERWEDLP